MSKKKVTAERCAELIARAAYHRLGGWLPALRLPACLTLKDPAKVCHSVPSVRDAGFPPMQRHPAASACPLLAQACRLLRPVCLALNYPGTYTKQRAAFTCR